jgi:hypothetical protein
MIELHVGLVDTDFPKLAEVMGIIRGIADHLPSPQREKIIDLAKGIVAACQETLVVNHEQP